MRCAPECRAASCPQATKRGIDGKLWHSRKCGEHFRWVLKPTKASLSKPSLSKPKPTKASLSKPKPTKAGLSKPKPTYVRRNHRKLHERGASATKLWLTQPNRKLLTWKEYTALSKEERSVYKEWNRHMDESQRSAKHKKTNAARRRDCTSGACARTLHGKSNAKLVHCCAMGRSNKTRCLPLHRQDADVLCVGGKFGHVRLQSILKPKYEKMLDAAIKSTPRWPPRARAPMSPDDERTEQPRKPKNLPAAQREQMYKGILSSPKKGQSAKTRANFRKEKRFYDPEYDSH